MHNLFNKMIIVIPTFFLVLQSPHIHLINSNTALDLKHSYMWTFTCLNVGCVHMCHIIQYSNFLVKYIFEDLTFTNLSCPLCSWNLGTTEKTNQLCGTNNCIVNSYHNKMLCGEVQFIIFFSYMLLLSGVLIFSGCSEVVSSLQGAGEDLSTPA